QRLEFMDEGRKLVEQLETVHCPVCGSGLETHVDQGLCVGGEASAVSLADACAAEMKKIKLQQRDLDGALADIKSEMVELRSQARVLAVRLEGVQGRIEGELEPALAATRSELESLVTERSRVDAQRIRMERLEELRKLVREEETRSVRPAREAVSVGGSEEIDTVAVRVMCDSVGEILNSWHFPCKTVEFGQKSFDLLVDGVPRRGNGKGVRGLWHSAFNIGLMFAAIGGTGRHPGFVVLDSPLTTLREGLSSENQEEVSGEMQQAFFSELAKLDSSYQVIVLENKEPAPTVAAKIKLTRFVGSKGDGRHGFFPVTEQVNTGP
ncbi:MAG: hypothetical protein ABIT01_17150, partial [Thermoanaerobaculia bacterium]